MNFLQQTSLGLSFLWLVGSFAPALASAAKSAPQTFSGAAGQKDPSWIDLATSYGNPYVRDDVDLSLIHIWAGRIHEQVLIHDVAPFLHEGISEAELAVRLYLKMLLSLIHILKF